MKRIITIFLVLSTLLCLCACGEETDTSVTESSTAVVSQAVSTEESKAESKEESVATASFKVKVVDEEGNVISGVMVQLCKDTCMPAMSNSEGIATFNAEITEGHKLSVLSCPNGYVYEGEAEVYLDSGITEYTVTLKKGE